MEKKLQINGNNNIMKKCVVEKAEKGFASTRPNTKSNRNVIWNTNYHSPRNNNFKNKQKPSFPQSLSLSNEDFITANSQIWINEASEDYNENDVYTQWKNIVQINFYSKEEEAPQCPICLSAPEVPRADRCGHVYCLPCLCKYLSLHTYFHSKCALCSQPLLAARIKRTAVLLKFPLGVGDTISMLLMHRHRDGCFPAPFNTVLKGAPPFINSPESRFSQIAVCPNNDLLTIIEIELCTLENLLIEAVAEENDRLESIKAALESVKVEKEVFLQQKKSSKTLKVDLESTETDLCVYYQAEDGGNVFLCPLNWRVMVGEFGIVGGFPARVTAPIVGVERFMVTVEFQDRYRYLRYLPVGCEVSFVELDLGAVVSGGTLEKFGEEIAGSRRRRERVKETEDSYSNISSGRAAEFTRVESAMLEETAVFTEEDFVPLPSSSDGGAASGSSSSSSNTKKETMKKSFADMIQRPSIINQTADLSLTEETSVPNRGFSLSDGLVVKTRKKRR